VCRCPLSPSPYPATTPPLLLYHFIPTRLVHKIEPSFLQTLATNALIHSTANPRLLSCSDVSIRRDIEGRGLNPPCNNVNSTVLSYSRTPIGQMQREVADPRCILDGSFHRSTTRYWMVLIGFMLLQLLRSRAGAVT
jgi:hypothetical protein